MWCELLVVGPDHAGVQAALTAARAGVRAAVVLPPTGARPTATQLYAAVDELMERLRTRESNRIPTAVECRDVVSRILARERQLAERLLERAGVVVLVGEWRWLAANRLEVADNSGWHPVEGEKVVIATGDDFASPRWAWDKSGADTLESLFDWAHWPATAVVVGGDRVGGLVSQLLTHLGVTVTAVERRATAQVQAARTFAGVWATAMQVECGGDHAIVTHDGCRIVGEKVLFATGRQARTMGRNFARLGLKVDTKGRLWCGSNYETVLPGLYATGTAVAEPTATNGFDSAVAILKDAFPVQAAAASNRRRLPKGWKLVG